MPYDPTAPAPAPVGPAPEPSSLPQLLSAIGGLGLNLAGLATSTGAHGQQALSLSEQLKERADKEQKKAQNKNIAAEFKARLPEVENQNARKTIGAALDNDQLPEAQSVFYHELSLQNQAKSQRKNDDRLQHYDDAQIGKALGDYTVERTKAATEALKRVPPAYAQAMGDEAFFGSQQKIFGDPQELKQAYNARKDVQRKLNDKEATTLFNRYNEHVNASRSSVLGSDLLGKTLGLGTAQTPQQIFSGYAAKTLTPDEVASAEAVKSEVAAHRAALQEAHQLRRGLANPLTRSKARQDAELFLSGAGGQAAPAPAAPGGSPGPAAAAPPPKGVDPADWAALSPAGQAALAAHLAQSKGAKK